MEYNFSIIHKQRSDPTSRMKSIGTIAVGSRLVLQEISLSVAGSCLLLPLASDDFVLAFDTRAGPRIISALWREGRKNQTHVMFVLLVTSPTPRSIFPPISSSFPCALLGLDVWAPDVAPPGPAAPVAPRPAPVPAVVAPAPWALCP